MVETAVSSALQKIAAPLIQEAAFLRGVPHDITWLRSELRLMMSYLKGAESKARTGDDAGELIKSWIREIRDVAYEAEDTIDLVVLMIHRRHQHTRIGCTASIKRYALSIPTELCYRHRIGTKIRALKTRISDIDTRRARYGIVGIGEGGEEEVKATDDRLNAQRRISPWLDEPMDIVGFKKEEEALVEQLVDAKIEPRLRIISIVGMGGLGKTTLARKIYSRPQVKTHFDALACVSVSRDFNAAAVLKDILKQFNLIREEPERREMDQDDMRKKLYEYLKERRYFIILDDVWEVHVWYQLKVVFPDMNNGSSVMLTTRNSDVAECADPSTPYLELRKLNDDESWELFCKKAFPTTESKDLLRKEKLEELGRQLTGRCGGLPLALVVLGGLLSREPTHAMWSNVAKSMDWESTTDGHILLDILSLSYRDLPHHHLKSCFLYIGSFPEDTVIPACRLIRLWIAEGFVAPKSNQVTEETARVYLDELVRRCMIEVVERGKAPGRVKYIRIHDLFRDFCITEGRKNGFMSVCSGSDMSLITTSSDAMPCYRMALHYGIDVVELASSMPKLHTILWFSRGRSTPLFVGFKLLRVLDVECVSLRLLLNLPKETEGLIHLRYLGWRRGRVEGLPSPVGLCNLQTMDLRDSHVYGIPDSLWNVRSLRHVHLGYVRGSFPSPSPVPALKWLQTLCGIPAGRWTRMNMATATGLKKLGIKGISSSHEEALATSLGKLDRLASLSLEREAHPGQAPFGKKIFDTFPNLHTLRKLEIFGRIRDFSSSSKFPPNLIKLTLGASDLDQDAITELEKLPNLFELNLMLEAYLGDCMSFSAHGFPELRFLTLSTLTLLKFWSVEAGATPRLAHLTVEACPYLEMLPEGLQHITSLQELKLIDMPKKWSSRIHEGDGEDWHKIQHVPLVQLGGSWS